MRTLVRALVRRLARAFHGELRLDAEGDGGGAGADGRLKRHRPGAEPRRLVHTATCVPADGVHRAVDVGERHRHPLAPVGAVPAERDEGGEGRGDGGDVAVAVPAAGCTRQQDALLGRTLPTLTQQRVLQAAGGRLATQRGESLRGIVFDDITS